MLRPLVAIGITRHIIPSQVAMKSTKALGHSVTIGASALKVALEMQVLSLTSTTFLISLFIVGIARHKRLFWTLSQKKRDEVFFLWADVHKRIQVFFIVY
nr:MAG TPA: hypothetical protein [Caudoviricetes sp.]